MITTSKACPAFSSFPKPEYNRWRHIHPAELSLHEPTAPCGDKGNGGRAAQVAGLPGRASNGPTCRSRPSRSSLSDTEPPRLSLPVLAALTEEEADAVRDPLYDSASAELALAVLKEARENGLWLRCDCRIDGDDDPLVASCRRLPRGAGYTWRVLQGETRPQHHADCVFYRESRENRERQARVRPEGNFAALRAREGGNSAELHAHEDSTALSDPLHGLGTGSGREPGQRRMPALPGLLCRLVETAGLTRIRANKPEPDIAEWMDAMRAAARSLEVAPGHTLDRLLFVSRTDWDRRRAHARVREAARAFPDGHVPQGFMCFPVLHVGERSLPATRKYGELEVVSRIKRPTIGGRAVSGPYLFFGVVALTTRRRGYECVRAWAQPIVSVHRPVPVDSDFERRAFGTLTTTLRILSRELPDAEFEMEKPVFEMDTKQGPCLPDFLIKARRNGEVRTWVLEVMDFERPDYLAGKEVTHERMEELGPVILMDGKRFERGLTGEGRKVTERIRADLGR